jgi:hypothetical protein
MTAAELKALCDAQEIRLQALPGGRLDIDGPADSLTPDLLESLRGCKAELLALLADGPTCPACGSARIAQGRRRRWCIDCETDIGPVIGSQDLPEAAPAAIPDDRPPARPGWTLPPWPPTVPDSILADPPTPCGDCGRPVGKGQPGTPRLCFGCWQGRLVGERMRDSPRNERTAARMTPRTCSPGDDSRGISDGLVGCPVSAGSVAGTCESWRDEKNRGQP